MISETHWKILEDANRQLALRFEKLKKARANGDLEGIEQARDGVSQSLADTLHRRANCRIRADAF